MAGFYKEVLPEPRTVPPFNKMMPNPKRYYVLDLGFETACWYWAGDFNESGYAVFNIARPRNVPVHRSYYQMVIGVIPDGMHLHHLCAQKSCVNPHHLQVLSPSQHAALHHSLKKR